MHSTEENWHQAEAALNAKAFWRSVAEQEIRELAYKLFVKKRDRNSSEGNWNDAVRQLSLGRRAVMEEEIRELAHSLWRAGHSESAEENWREALRLRLAGKPLPDVAVSCVSVLHPRKAKHLLVCLLQLRRNIGCARQLFSRPMRDVATLVRVISDFFCHFSRRFLRLMALCQAVIVKHKGPGHDDLKRWVVLPLPPPSLAYVLLFLTV
jgi:hypothetical protein